MGFGKTLGVVCMWHFVYCGLVAGFMILLWHQQEWTETLWCSLLTTDIICWVLISLYLDIVGNFPGFRITWETHLRSCLQGCFQDLNQERRWIINVGAPSARVSGEQSVGKDENHMSAKIPSLSPDLSRCAPRLPQQRAVLTPQHPLHGRLYPSELCALISPSLLVSLYQLFSKHFHSGLWTLLVNSHDSQGLCGN